MRLWSRAAYVAVTGVLTLAGGAAAAAAGWGPTEAVAAGLATAWVLQAPSFWRLAGALARGRSAVRPWLGGIALRLGGLGLVAVAGATTALPARETAMAYVAALMTYLGLEALWLYRRQPDGRPGRPAAGPARDEDDVDDSTRDEHGRAAGAGTRRPHR